MTVFEVLSYIAALLLVVAVVWSIVMMATGSPWVLEGLNNRCGKLSVACNTLAGFVIPFLSVALASAAFLFYRLRYVKSQVTKQAKNRPHKFVQTAGPNIGTIVGRDELCHVIMEDIRDRAGRRPHLIVGGVGTGKTAVLVRLTKLLAEHGAIPVPIRLRDAQEELNFREMGWQRFRGVAEGRLVSTGEAEKVWRQLRKDDRVVIIADGLEEALSESGTEKDRDNLIRLAIAEARELKLPLIIASRPHEPLRGADATIIELEPLSEEAALEYIGQGARGDHDMRRLDWIVETAGLTELPLYLRITRQLRENDRLDHLTAGRDRRRLDTRSVDRSELRVNLLRTWMEALFDGHLRAAVPLSRAEREAAVVWVSALACIGLKQDTIDVKFDNYYKGRPGNGQQSTADGKGDPRYRSIDEAVQRALKQKLPRPLDVRLAVTWADRLGLVNAHGDGLRFPHSIMQAYLGSRFMSTALEDPEFYKDAEDALKHPGREFLIALVLYCRAEAVAAKYPTGRELEAGSAAPLPIEAAPAGSAAPSATAPAITDETAAAPEAATASASKSAALPASAEPAPPEPTPTEPSSTAPAATKSASPGPPEATAPVTTPEPDTASAAVAQAATPQAARGEVGSIRDLLKRSAQDSTDAVKALDIYAAALEIDSFLDNPDHLGIAASVVERWPNIRSGDQQTLDEAKLGLVRRFGDAARTIALRREQARHSRGSRPGGRASSIPEPAYLQLLTIGRLEQSYPIRLAVAQEIGAGGDDAFRVLHDQIDMAWRIATGQEPTDDVTPGSEAERAASGTPAKPSLTARSRADTAHQGTMPPDTPPQEARRQDTASASQDSNICAWLTPLLVGSVDSYRDQAQELLAHWLDCTRHDGSGPTKALLPIPTEIALAQGFKYAANRRRRHPHARPETRVYLAEQAMEMLKEARFWFSQLTLIHALCLWEMPEPDMQRPGDAANRGDGRTRHPPHRRGDNPEAIVGGWLKTARNPDHPFVATAGELAVNALRTRQPERFIWIDEIGVVSKVGSSAMQRTKDRQSTRYRSKNTDGQRITDGQSATYRKHNLWIPPSIGWASLAPRAQQLVADVLLLLNLAERGERPKQIEQRLKRAERSDLPPCLTDDRSPLDPRRTVGAADTSAPGTNCMDGCQFRLCPYPPNGGELHRAELSEAFCRSQQTLLSMGLRPKAAPWQAIKPADLKHFWTQMADRARGGGSADLELD